ncbi:MAG: PIG-L family deacetylase [Flavobacteriales bacterium]|nr:PIG-L family deacetylase [Flavobacteriales bacterium]
MKKISFTLLLAVFSVIACAQPEFTPASVIRSQISGLKTTASVLYIAAHPDDENTRLISYLTNEKKYRVGYLSLTRGDGGQNLIGNEQGEELGIIRTQELLAARRTDGAEQFFTRAFDFGYSKNPEETFRKWGKENILADVVFVIRYFRPDIIICRFPTTGEGGHGHHTASAILAEEAFELAADPNQFKDQLLVVQPWKAKRILWNTFNFGSTNTTSEDQLKIDVGGYDPLTGKSYGETASEARSQHRSQAFGTERRRGEQFEYFKTIKGDAPTNDLMDGVITDWSKNKVTAKFVSKIKSIEKKFNDYQPSLIIPDLLKLRAEMHKVYSTSDLANRNLIAYKMRQVDKIISECSGLFFDVLSTQAYAVNGDSIGIRIQCINRSEFPVSLTELQTPFGNWSQPIILEKNKWKSIDIKLPVNNISISNPYAHRYRNSESARNTIYSGTPLQFLPEWHHEIEYLIRFKFQQSEIDFVKNIQHKIIDPSFGETYRPLFIAPPVAINFEEENYVFLQGQSRKIKISARSFKNNLDATISLETPVGIQVTEKDKRVHFDLAGETKIIEFEILPQNLGNINTSTLKLVAEVEGKLFDLSFHQIKYDHIPEQVWFSSSGAGISVVDVKRNTQNIAYIDGAGDKIPEVLNQLGYHVTLLKEDNLLTTDYKKFDAVITGVRAFNTVKNLRYANKVLFEYVNQGGILLVQYNTSSPLVTTELGPYPFKLSRERITEEDSPVEFLFKDHPLLKYPNLITNSDFDGWIQERGLYFPTEVDNNYSTPLKMKDSGSDANPNSILYCQYGKGKYIYTGISFFREIPAGVPGAIKLFVNLISKNENVEAQPINQVKNGK